MFDYTKMNQNEQRLSPLKTIIPGLNNIKVKLKEYDHYKYTQE